MKTTSNIHRLYNFLWESPNEKGVINLLQNNNLEFYSDTIKESCQNLEVDELFSTVYLDSEEKLESLEATKNGTTDIKIEEVNYQLNKYGLRYTGTDIIKESVDTLVFGCSFTFGVGIPFEKTWAHQVNNAIRNNTYVNLAIPGSSISKITRLLYTVTYFKNPKRIIILLPDYNREEVVINKTHLNRTEDTTSRLFHVHNFVPTYNSKYKSIRYFVNNYKSTVMLENNKINTFKNLQIIKLLTDLLNIDLYISSWCPYTYQMLEEVFDKSQIAPYYRYTRDNTLFARDGGHPGLNDNRVFKEQLLNFIKTVSKN